jgi:hypothetical protein
MKTFTDYVQISQFSYNEELRDFIEGLHAIVRDRDNTVRLTRV